MAVSIGEFAPGIEGIIGADNIAAAAKMRILD